MVGPVSTLIAGEGRALVERSPKLSADNRLVAFDQSRPDHNCCAVGIAAHIEDDGRRVEDGIECSVRVSKLQTCKINVAITRSQLLINLGRGAVGRNGDGTTIRRAASDFDVAQGVLTLDA